MMTGKEVLEIGCAQGRVAPWSLVVDEEASPGVGLRVSVSPDTGLLAQVLGHRQFDVVFSAHLLEHLRTPILETLRYWFSFVRERGVMILYLPDERSYVFDSNNLRVRNPDHRHYLTPDTFVWYLEQLPSAEVVEVSPDVNPSEQRHSFLCVVKRVG